MFVDSRFATLFSHGASRLDFSIVYFLTVSNFDNFSDFHRSKISNVELDTPKITQEQISAIENEVNDDIAKHINIIIHLMSKEEAMELEEVKTRGLPDDVLDNIRVIEIEGNLINFLSMPVPWKGEFI